MAQMAHFSFPYYFTIPNSEFRNRPFSHCLCACVYRSRGALFLGNRRDFTEMGQTDFKPLILSMLSMIINDFNHLFSHFFSS